MPEIDLLLVEDSPSDAMLAKVALKEASPQINVHHVEDGELALQFLRRQKQFAESVQPDIILLDINLPKKDGWEVLEEIRSDKALSSMPVIVFSTSNAPKDVDRSYAMHANSFVQKPVELAAYNSVIRAMSGFWFDSAILPSGSSE